MKTTSKRSKTTPSGGRPWAQVCGRVLVSFGLALALGQQVVALTSTLTDYDGK